MVTARFILDVIIYYMSCLNNERLSATFIYPGFITWKWPLSNPFRTQSITLPIWAHYAKIPVLVSNLGIRLRSWSRARIYPSRATASKTRLDTSVTSLTILSTAWVWQGKWKKFRVGTADQRALPASWS